MKKIWGFLVTILVFLSLVALGLRFGSEPAKQFLGLEGRSGLRIESIPEAKVWINGLEMGQTPYESDQLKPGTSLVELKSDLNGQNVAWVGNVPFNNGTITVVNRELAPNQASSSGEVISLEKGSGVMVISSPSEAMVTIDGTDVGKSPISVDLEPGEHVFAIGKLGYLTRSIKANLLKDQKLVINADLSLSEADLTRVELKPLLEVAKIEVMPTSTGFLRVRQGPTVGSLEVGRVKPGEVLDVVGETGGWYKVRLVDGKEGYVSASFVKKLE